MNTSRSDDARARQKPRVADSADLNPLMPGPVSAVCPAHVYATGYSLFNVQFAQVSVPSHWFSNVRGVGFPI